MARARAAPAVLFLLTYVGDAAVPDPGCWKPPRYTAERCCARPGEGGLSECWANGFTYDLCCTVPAPVARASALHPSSLWCGRVCREPETGTGDRVCEALRNAVVSALVVERHQALAGVAGVMRRVGRGGAGLGPLAAMLESDDDCPGAMVASVLQSVEDDGAASMLAPRLRSTLSDKRLQRVALCSGWPLFKLLSVARVNQTFRSRAWMRQRQGRPAWASSAVETWEQAHAQIDRLAAYMQACPSADFGKCFVDVWPVLERLHDVQQSTLFGWGTCPPGTFATWLDDMAPANAFPLCVRGTGERTDVDLKQLGGLGVCREVANLAALFGAPGCRVLDIGANIGACSVMLALLGHRVDAFEPLPLHLDMLRASARLNGIAAADHGAPAAVVVHPHALADDPGRERLLEGRDNSGMSTIVPLFSSQSYCDDASFICDRERWVETARLDDEFGPDAGEFCVAKIDVEGNELRVLRGAAALLRARRVRAMIFEWWPPHLRVLGEDPLALLWYLHALRYHVYAPGRWFAQGEGWRLVVPAEFTFLLGHWGDLVARPFPPLTDD